ncbi:MAG: hypothetical protein HC888_09540 [Candidatus Competibacteraceae bacterium]|nr:hypothetical protein [Candidatus Competibacteraceae bacterium]
MTAGYREPSLVFLAGTNTQLFSEHQAIGAARFIAQDACSVALVDKRHEPAFRKEAARLGAEIALKTRVNGFNLTGGRWMDIGVYINADSPAPTSD